MSDQYINVIEGYRVAKKCMYCSSDNSELKFEKSTVSGWKEFYSCVVCDRKYLFVPNDMGQSSDILAHVKEIPKDE